MDELRVHDPESAAFSAALLALLQESLAGVLRRRATTLLAGFNGQEVVAEAMQGLSLTIPLEQVASLGQAVAPAAVFSELVVEALVGGSDCDGKDRSGGADRGSRPEPAGNRARRDPFLSFQSGQMPVVSSLAKWLETICPAASEIHLNALEMVMARLEGCDERRLAEQWNLPLRLVRRVVQDIVELCLAAQ